MGRDRNERGRYADGIDPETVMDVFDARDDAARPVTASDVVEELGIARRTAHNKLNALVERGTLDTRKIGARGRVWWIPDRGDADTFDAEDLRGDATTTLADESGESDARADSDADATDGPADPPADAHGAEEDTARADAAGVLFPQLDLPGSGDNLEGRRDGVRAIYEYLKEHGKGRRSDFKEVVDVEKTGYATFNSFYTNCVDNGGLLADLPGVKSPGEGGHTYRYEP